MGSCAPRRPELVMRTAPRNRRAASDCYPTVDVPAFPAPPCAGSGSLRAAPEFPAPPPWAAPGPLAQLVRAQS